MLQPAPTTTILECPHTTLTEIRVERDNGWLAGTVKVNDGPADLCGRFINVSGVLPGGFPGACYSLILIPAHTVRYGEQYRIEAASMVMPLTVEGIATYLKGAIVGIGPKRSQAIVQAFGIDTIKVLDAEGAATRLASEANLPSGIANNIVRQWHEQQAERLAMLTLTSCGLSLSLCVRASKFFGAELAKVLQQTPYRLIEVPGIGFPTADAVALRIGMPPDSPERCWAGLTHEAQQAAKNGHCWTLLEHLVAAGAELLNQPPSVIQAALDHQPQHSLLTIDAERRVWLSRLQNAERLLARTIHLLQTVPTPHAESIAQISWPTIFASQAVTLTDEQQRAVQFLLKHKIALLTGGPGTGKSTVMRAVLDALRAAKIGPVHLCAPTGKAARRLSETTGVEATTIHRLLEWQDGPSYYPGHPLPTAVVIVDESSMIDVELACCLIIALPPHAHLIMVGDDNQLPSVGPGRVLQDLQVAGLPTVHLQTIHRQAQQSLIVRAAHTLNAGDVPEFNNNLATDDCFFFDYNHPDELLNQVVDLVSRRIPQRFGIASSAIRVLAPQYGGTVGIDALNRRLQAALNPPASTKSEISWGEHILRVGDRLVWLSNSYDLGLINGEEVTVLAITKDDKRTMVMIAPEDGPPQTVRLVELDARHAYALSVHKSQGSEYQAVLLVVHSQHQWMLTRRLTYTGITRAQRLCVLLGQRRALARAAGTDRETSRRTALVERLQGRSQVLAAVPQSDAA